MADTDLTPKEEVKDTNEVKPYDDLAKQCKVEFDQCLEHQRPKRQEAMVRLKLYNNQKRDKDAVGDTTLFSIFQTVLASLYTDRLMVEWEGREEGDDETAENLNTLAENDYEDMGKDELDFYWIWNTLFFGRGMVDLSEYHRDPETNTYLPIPELIDNMTFLRDPNASSINGDRKGRGSCRFFGSEITMTKRDIEDLPDLVDGFDMHEIKFGQGKDSLTKDSREARNTAQGRQTQKMESQAALKDNGEYDITRWFTYANIEGRTQKVKVWLANERAKVIAVKVLGDDDWTIIDRPLYPTAGDWDGTSLPDLIEDKQRARAVAQNLGLNAMKADLYPMYIYDSNKISNRKDLNFDFDKFIPMDGKGENLNTAIMPMIKSRPNMQLLDFIYTSLDVSSQKATATPELQQGAMSDNERTLGELNLIASKADTRYSLSAKVFGWSERDFWRQWYRLYKDNFESKIDEKIVRLSGTFGAKFKKLTRENIITEIDPDVKIESKVLSRAKQLEERQTLTVFFGLALAEPTANRRYGLRKLAKLNGMEKDEIERLFPLTIDERIAEDQNELLSDNEFVEVLAEDDHNVHLEVHNKASDTDAKEAHIKTHEKALSIKKTNPEFFPEEDVTEYQPATEDGSGGVSELPQPIKPISPSQTSNQP